MSVLVVGNYGIFLYNSFVGSIIVSIQHLFAPFGPISCRMGPTHFLAGWHVRPLSQALVELSLAFCLC